MIQRAVLTAHGRQFTLNGYLALSKTGGKRLIITENFGAMLADVLVKPDGKIFVMRSSRLFRPEWIQRYVVTDMECVFGEAPQENCPGKMISPAHFLIQHRGYTLDLQIVESRSPNRNCQELFDATNEARFAVTMQSSIAAARIGNPQNAADGPAIFVNFVFRANDSVFAGHFPNRPLLPGIFQLEMTRAAAGWF